VPPVRVLVLLVLLVVVGPVAPAWADEWRWPLDGDPAVSRPFVAPAHRYAAGHRGADLPSAPGAVVRAAGDGLVSYAGLVAGRGVVAVVHGDLRTTYEPVSALVDVGTLVAAGQVLGTLEAGHLGCPARACLHWGLRRGEDYLDPVRLVRPGPVRLLPLEGAVTALPAGVAEPARGTAPAAEPARAEAPDGDGPVLAPDEPPASRTTDIGLAATAGASLLGAAAAVGVARRRPR
jgi:hypothetical protein